MKQIWAITLLLVACGGVVYAQTQVDASDPIEAAVEPVTPVAAALSSPIGRSKEVQAIVASSSLSIEDAIRVAYDQRSADRQTELLTQILQELKGINQKMVCQSIGCVLRASK